MPTKLAGLALLVLAYALLVPGLTEPMLSVSGTVERAELVELGRELLHESPDVPGFVAELADRVIERLDVAGEVLVFDKTRSILGTAAELRANGHLAVAVLIVLFSVVVPTLKAAVLLVALAPFAPRARRPLARLANAIGKWSMADVFVVAIFVAFLAGRGLRSDRGLVDFDAGLGAGFWYFLGYCLVSVLGTQLLVAALAREIGAAADGAAGEAEHGAREGPGADAGLAPAPTSAPPTRGAAGADRPDGQPDAS